MRTIASATGSVPERSALTVTFTAVHLTGVQASLAAILLTAMYASFARPVHLPLLADHSPSSSGARMR
jgi:hypothetical protein